MLSVYIKSNPGMTQTTYRSEGACTLQPKSAIFRFPVDNMVFSGGSIGIDSSVRLTSGIKQQILRLDIAMYDMFGM
jgi:hypothetical protein